MIRNVIFDFDGTIADDLRVMLDKFNNFAHEYNLPEIKDGEIESFRGQGSKEIFSNLPISKIRLLLLIRRLQWEFGNSISECKPFKDIPQVLSQLKKNGYKLGIISSNTKKNVVKFLDYHKINLFDFVHCGRNLFGKEHVIKMVLRGYGLSPEETVYVGDEDRDINAANGAGISIISVTWGFNNKKLLTKSGAKKIANKPRDLLKLVK